MNKTKVTKTYSKIKECTSFLSWLFFETDYPAEWSTSGDRWYNHCGSPHRRHFIRCFGHEWEYTYWE